MWDELALIAGETGSWTWESLVSVASRVSVVGNRLGDWMRRHRRKLIIAGVLTGTGLIAVKVIQYKLNQFTKSLELEMKERNKNRMKAYFENAQRSCDQSVIAGLPRLKSKISEITEMPSTHDLRNSSAQATKEQKLEMWENVKIAAFTRALTSIYASVMMTLFARVKVNILGRYLYMQSDDSEKPIVSQETIREYLGYETYFLQIGSVDLATFVNNKVKEEMAAWPVSKKYTLEHINALLNNLRGRIEGNQMGNPSTPFYNFLLPAEDSNPNLKEISQLEALLNETRDVTESEKFCHVLKNSLDFGFSMLLTSLAPTFNVQPGSAASVVPMPNIIPQVREQYSKLLDYQSNHDGFFNLLFRSQDLEEYSYYIFTSSYDQE